MAKKCEERNAYHRQQHFNIPIDFLEGVLKIAKEVGDKASEGHAYGSLGCAYHRLGDFKTAIGYHERHLKITKEVGDKAGEGMACCNLGSDYQSLGDFKAAIDYHGRDLEIAKEVGDKASEGMAYGSLGCAYHRLGDFKTAIDYQERHLKITKEVGDKAVEGSTYGNLGNTYQCLGYFKKAIDCYKRSLKTAKEVGDKAAEGNAYGNLGNAYGNLEDFESAIDHHERHLKIARELGDKAGEGKAYGNLGNNYLRLGDFKTANDYLKRCLNINKDVGDKVVEGSGYGNLGNVYQTQGDFKTAIDYHKQHLNIAKDVGDNAATAISFFNLGRSFELHRSLPEALDCFHSSVKIFNIVRHDLKGKDEWKINYRNMYEMAYTSLWRLLLKQGEVERALFAAEQGRAQALNDLMELNYGLETTHSQVNLEESTCQSFSFPRSVTVFMAINEQEIVFWVVQEREHVELRKKELSHDNSLNLNDFLESLIVSASHEIGVRTGAKCEDRSLDKLRVEQMAKERSPQTPKPVPFQMNTLRTLYDVIIDPIADFVCGNELILVPEGPLCLAPFAAFVDSKSTYLCDVCRTRVIPSLTSLKLITNSPAGYHRKTGVLLVGDPWVQEVVIPGQKLEQLPCARKEVQMIGRICNTKPLTGREATKDEVLRRLPSVALIHIAAHGRMSTGEIALAPNTTGASQIPEEEDFLLRMKDVKSAQIRARLVVLSCCHSGHGEVKPEGIVGIARAFLGAGARAVVVTLWAIDDEATLEFMNIFYSHLVKGISASESLNKAMKRMRESDEFNEVKHWAPFVLIGDDVTLELGGSAE